MISVGDVVLIEEDKVPRLCWRMGLLERLTDGKDRAARRGVVRGVVVSKRRREYQDQ